jgi:type III pantothenate kinase
MLLTVSIENTFICIGIFSGAELIMDTQIATNEARSVDEYAILLSGMLAMNSIACKDIDGAIISSVVRPLNDVLRCAIEKLTGIHPLMLGPGIKTGLSLKTDFPSQLGGDLVANAVASIAIMDPPFVIVDLGTATTLTGINGKGELCGVIICPGAVSALNALSRQAAELPRIAVDTPRDLLGKNTNDSMTSGIVYGHAAMIDGLLDRIAEAWDTNDLKVIATGELSGKILPYSKRNGKIIAKPHLTLTGLMRIYSLNSRNRS